MECDDKLVCGIREIYNEVPIRDGRPFPHYGKKFDTVKREVTTMPDRSEFLGAYCGEELIGFIKLIHMGKLSSILHIVSKRAHYDKRPTNSLLAAAVEVVFSTRRRVFDLWPIPLRKPVEWTTDRIQTAKRVYKDSSTQVFHPPDILGESLSGSPVAPGYYGNVADKVS